MTQFMDVMREKDFSFAVGAKKNTHKSVRAFNAEIFFAFKVTKFASKRFFHLCFLHLRKFGYREIYYFN